ncbi:uncharacterized protein DUF4112 [Hoeflea marina]|uniref:Uncharacterized protein DUF4112 n=1 Tax=Hoeflea marina TaxID=274592 RepID=A0A317PMC8_9HYPH|nr:DUF4112 domain-containing protein [Hoeflea marina]PWW02095.1 uncharacterized protein DUF4112 [Hoeflea marina]
MSAELRRELSRLDTLANALDSQFRIPGIGMRIGWDGILGLVPGVGDAVTLLPAAYLLYKGHRLGARRMTLMQMALNSGIDLAIGAVPLLGDLFDIGFKANKRNVALLRRDIEARIEEVA